jgi:DNA-binding LacI/PurR family transcriptional regulator
MGVYEAARELGLRIPEDLSVVGFDNLGEVVCFNPPLTTIDQSIAEMGASATEMIVKLVRGESLPNPADGGNLYKVPTRLVVRESCAPVPGHSPDESMGAYLATQ